MIIVQMTRITTSYYWKKHEKVSSFVKPILLNQFLDWTIQYLKLLNKATKNDVFKALCLLLIFRRRAAKLFLIFPLYYICCCCKLSSLLSSLKRLYQKKMRLAPNYSTDEKFPRLTLCPWNFVKMTSSWVGNIAWILSYFE